MPRILILPLGWFIPGLFTPRGLVPIIALLFLASSPYRVSWAQNLNAEDARLAKLAFAAADKGKWSEVAGIKPRIRNNVLVKLLDWMDLSRSDAPLDFVRLDSFLQTNPYWPNRTNLRSKAEMALPDYMPHSAILGWFKKEEPQTFIGGWRLAAAYQATKQQDKAKAMAQKAWREWPGRSQDEEEFLKTFGRSLTAADYQARLKMYLWREDYEGAKRMYSRLPGEWASLGRAQQALMQGKSNALTLLKQVPAKVRREAVLLYAEARYYRRNNNEAKAPQSLFPLPATIDRPDLFWGELERAVRIALENKNYELAYKLARGHAASSGASFAEGEWLAGWIALRFQKDAERALNHFTALYQGVTSPISRGRGAYWAGVAARATKNEAAATQWFQRGTAYPTTFYGQLSIANLGSKAQFGLPPSKKPTKAEANRMRNYDMVIAVRMLAEIQQKGWQRPFLLRMAELAASEGELHFVADLAAEIGRPDLAIEVAKAGRSNGFELVDHLFPVQAHSSIGNVEKALVLAIIKQESSFDPHAKSSAGALGLMQLMPATAKHMANRLKISYDKNKLTSPAYNVQLGSAYVDNMLERWQGSYVLSIASYNAGPGRVSEWLAKNGMPGRKGQDIVDWIEQIPFSETRNYVQRVMENLQIYRLRLGKNFSKLQIAEDLSRGH